MNPIILFFLGTVRLRIMGASPEWCLNRFARERLPFWELKRIDPFTLTVRVLRRDEKRASELAQRAMCEPLILRRFGFQQIFYGLRRRRVLLAGLSLALAAALILPNFVWTVDVQGYGRLHREELLRALAEEGVCFGAFGPSIDPQRLEHRMLERFHDLSWLTVNRSGGRVVVLVRERLLKPEILDERAVTNLVARKAGLIVSVQALSGKAICRQGQLVLPGELLISGLVDQGAYLEREHALGEVYARTWSEVETVRPDTRLQKTPEETEETAWYLIVGRKRIKIFGNSGIFMASCDKIMEDHVLTLPGGITFPLTLEIERRTDYTTSPVENDTAQTAAELEQSALDAVQKSLIAGQILDSTFQTARSGGCIRVTGIVSCQEEISRSVPVEISEGEN